MNQSRVPWFKTLGLNKYSAYLQKPWAYRPGFSAYEPPSHTTTKDVIFKVDHCGEERNRLFIIGSEELVKLVSLKAACSLKLLETCVQLMEHAHNDWHTYQTLKSSFNFMKTSQHLQKRVFIKIKRCSTPRKVFGFAPNCHIWMPSCTKTKGNTETASSVWPWLHHIGAVCVSIFIISC